MFDTENANLITDVEDIVVTFRITNLAEATTNQELSDKALGAFFALEGTSIPEDTRALAEHVATQDSITNGATEEASLVTYASVAMSSYTPILPEMTGYENTEELSISFTLESFEALTKEGVNYQLFIEPYVAETTTDGLVKLPIVQTTTSTATVSTLSAVALADDATVLETIALDAISDADRAIAKCVAIPRNYTAMANGTVQDTQTFAVTGALANMPLLQAVRLPETITEISEIAFAHNTSLKQIEIPSTVTKIGFASFGFSGLTSITIPANVETVEVFALAFCTSLKSVDFEEGSKLTNLGTAPAAYASAGYVGNVFNSSAVETIDLSNCTSLTEITANTFFNATSLKKLVLSDALTSFDSSLLSGLTALEYNQSNGFKGLGSKNNPYLVLIEGTDNTITSLEVPEGTKFIFENAFYEFESLAGVKIPATVLSIGGGAFAYTAIRQVWLPSTTTLNYYEDGDYIGVFYGCCEHTKADYNNKIYATNVYNLITVYTDASESPTIWHNWSKNVGIESFDEQAVTPFNSILNTTYEQYLAATGNAL